MVKSRGWGGGVVIGGAVNIDATPFAINMHQRQEQWEMDYRGLDYSFSVAPAKLCTILCSWVPCLQGDSAKINMEEAVEIKLTSNATCPSMMRLRDGLTMATCFS